MLFRSFYQAYDRVPLKPLDRSILSEAVRPEFVDWINRNVPRTIQNDLQELLFSLRGSGRLCRIFTGKIPTTVRFRAFMAYLVLYPIERLLKSRC